MYTFYVIFVDICSYKCYNVIAIEFAAKNIIIILGGPSMKNFEFPVSIGDASKAALALRSYGLTQKEAEETISKESVVAIYEHRIIPKNSISPDLIEIFGIQHIEDAIAYSYLYMDEFDIEWDILKLILNNMLCVFRPEELILNPELIRNFLNTISILEEEKAQEKAERGENIVDSLIFAEVLDDLQSEDLKAICENTDYFYNKFIENDDDDEDDDEEFDVNDD